MNRTRLHLTKCLILIFALWILVSTTGLRAEFNRHLDPHLVYPLAGLVMVWGLVRLLRRSRRG